MAITIEELKPVGHGTRHGYSGRKRRPEYSVWSEMKQRCQNKNNSGYYKYGARGIKVCDRWQRFDNFIEDMGDRPSDYHSLERIDNNKGYSPDNCRWATVKEQANNRRNCRLLSAYGVTLNITQWAEVLEVPKSRLAARFYKGMSDHDILFKESRYQEKLSRKSKDIKHLEAKLEIAVKGMEFAVHTLDGVGMRKLASSKLKQTLAEIRAEK